MAILIPGRPYTQAQPRLMVENKLKPGLHRFRLTVTDESGNESAPDEIVMRVRAKVARREKGRGR
ncbi:MAG: hypothetical protein JNN33_11820 [Rhodospirillaceae bacterium]|jgi:hypothetical protein|nr:hypothetical protein [Rhodospirillaceae bacterium]